MFKSHLNLTESATVAINSLAVEKKSRGERVFNLSAGEPILPPHPIVARAARGAITGGKTLYPPVAGLPNLRQAASAWVNKTYSARYSPLETLITCGGKFAIFATIQAGIKSGDEVIIVSPYWVSYPAIVKLFGGKPIIVKTKAQNSWALDINLLASKITAQTKMIIINNGGNPTGVLYSKKVMAELVRLAVKNNIILLSDEVYSGLTYDGKYISAGSFSQVKENVVVVQSCSKHFAMTGWRVGVVFASEKLVKVLMQIQGQSTTGTSTVSQWAAVAAFDNAHKITSVVKKTMRHRRMVFVNTFNKLFSAKITPPPVGLYCFIPLSLLGVTTKNSKQFCLAALERGNVALVPGIAFGQEGFARASFGAPTKELVAALIALKKFVVSCNLN